MINTKASFCISTFRRPRLLQKQLELLSTQRYQNFEVIISDNDPEKSAEPVVKNLNDARFKYFSNEINLGMIKSFNKSIERSTGDYIIMATDDDPIDPSMLTELFRVVENYPTYALYCGCVRAGNTEGAIETYSQDDFVYQLLHPALTPNFLWSSCLVKREALLKVGGMPDYGSPHLADHAMLALCSKYGGGVMINKMYSRLESHKQNFSKSNFNLYYIGCRGFYDLIHNSFDQSAYIKNGENALLKHLETWFIANSFSLRKYFTFKVRNREHLKDVIFYSRKILELDFMKPVRKMYLRKLVRFYCKYPILALKSYA